MDQVLCAGAHISFRQRGIPGGVGSDNLGVGSDQSFVSKRPVVRPFFYLLIAAFLLLLALIAWIQVADRRVNPEVVIGTWQGTYFGGEETIEIRRNGTLRQTFKSGNKTVYDNLVTWRYIQEASDERGYLPGGVDVSGMMRWEYGDVKARARPGYSKENTLLVYNGAFDVLLISEEEDYYLNRRK